MLWRRRKNRSVDDVTGRSERKLYSLTDINSPHGRLSWRRLARQIRRHDGKAATRR